MIDYQASFTNTDGVAFPNTKTVNASSPGATDGTEVVKIFGDDLWGARQALMAEAGLTPNGITETSGSSQFVEALRILLTPIGFVSGLIMSNGTDADHDIDVSVGLSKDSTNAKMLELASSATKQLDAAWAVGTNVGGLFSGTVASGTWYHLFIIRNTSNKSIDAGFDTSITAANIPAGYSEFRRIGSVFTDGAANIKSFIDTELAGGSVHRVFIDRQNAYNGVPTATRTLSTVQSPPGVRSLVDLSLYLTHNDTNHLYTASPDTTDVAAGTGTMDVANTTSVDFHNNNVTVLTNTSSQVAHRATFAAGTFIMTTIGYTDMRTS